MGLRVIAHTQPFKDLKGFICEGGLRAMANIQPLDALEVREHCTSSLRQHHKLKLCMPLKVGESNIRDGGLVTPSHIQSVRV